MTLIIKLIRLLNDSIKKSIYFIIVTQILSIYKNIIFIFPGKPVVDFDTFIKEAIRNHLYAIGQVCILCTNTVWQLER